MNGKYIDFEFKHRAAWYNYRTQSYEYSDAPTTDEKALDFLPQIPAARGLYTCCRELGDDILHAMIKTLKACVGEHEK